MLNVFSCKAYGSQTKSGEKRGRWAGLSKHCKGRVFALAKFFKVAAAARQLLLSIPKIEHVDFCGQI